MSKLEFDEFVKRQQAEKQSAGEFDAKKQLAEWLDQLNALYRQITSFMESYTKTGDADIDYADVTLNEEFIGAYVARKMIIKIGRATVTFTPIGTMLIGMKGRVDVQGPSGRARLFLVNKKATSARSLIQVTVSVVSKGEKLPPPPPVRQPLEPEWAWKIGTSPPDVKFIELTEETFFDMILAVANA
jgi:hypothetical protein